MASSQIGIEIETHEIRAVKVRRREDCLHIEGRAIIPIKTDLTQALLELQTQWPGLAKAVVSLDYQKVFSKTIPFDSTLTKNGWQCSLQHQLQSLFGLSAEEVYCDYYCLTTAQKPPTCHLFAVKKSEVDEITSACRKAKIRLIAVDINILACTRLIYFVNAKADIFAIILFHSNCLRLCVFDQQQLTYTVSVDLVDIESDIHRALRFYYQTQPASKIKQLFLVGTKTTATSTEISQFNKKVFNGDSFDPRLWVAFALSTLGWVS